MRAWGWSGPTPMRTWRSSERLTTPPTRMSAVLSRRARLAPVRRHGYATSASLLLQLAVVALVLESTILPLLGMSAAQWNPGHDHASLSRTIPVHRHAWEAQAVAEATPSCAPTDPRQTEATPSAIECTSNHQAGGSVAAMVLSELPLIAIRVPDVELSTARLDLPPLKSAALPVPVPPPRG